jgi:DNA-binding NtrC family response regulator
VLDAMTTTTTKANSDNKEKGPRVLVLDDDEGVLKSVSRVLSVKGGCDVLSFSDPKEAQEALANDPTIDVAVLDVMLPQVSGLDILKATKAKRPYMAVVMMTASSSVETAVDAVKGGAFDYMTKPFDSLENIVLTVKRAWEHHRLLDLNRDLVRMLESKEGFEELIGQSPKMKVVFEYIGAVAPTPATVLVRGESGTGKELVARAIHRRSDRKDKPFIAVNCSALSESVLDSELFGYVKGAFTGAINNRKGMFEAAHTGTIFLDEIGDISAATQVRLLRVLQEGEVKPIGSNDTVHVDVRVIAATHVDLEGAIKKKTFREDLFYRLNVVPIVLPALRERPEDIMLLAHHFLQKHAARMKKNMRGFAEAAVRALSTHDWQGNVRELENAVARGVVLAPPQADGAVIESAHLPPGLGGAVPVADVEAAGVSHLPYAQAKKAALATFERHYLGAKLKLAKGNISQAARDSGMDRSNFKRLLREYGVVGDGIVSQEGEAID